MELAQKMRRNGVDCLVEYKERSLKSLMSRANKLKMSWVLIIGEEELKKGKFQLKNMETGEQKEMSPKEILDGFLRKD